MVLHMQEDAVIKTSLSVAAFASYFSGLPAEVVMGSILGSIYFTTAATEFTILRRSILALASFVAGLVLFSPFATMFISLTALIGVKAEYYNLDSVNTMGAFAASLLSVKLSIKAYDRVDIPRGSSDDVR